MKKIKSNLTTLLVLAGVLVYSAVNAQEKVKPYYTKGFRIGVGINGGLPTNNTYDGSVGIDARLQYDFDAKTSATLTAGYSHLFDDYAGDKGIVPIKAGFKYFVNKNIYALGEVGAGIGTHKEQDNTLIWSPSIGFANSYIDISLRYERYQDYNTDQLGIRVAYGFSLKNYNKNKK